MVCLRSSVVALFFALSWSALAQDEVPDAADTSAEPGKAQPAIIRVKISASFPSSEVFGIKLVNGHATQAVVSVENGEPEPIKVVFIAGSLMTPTGLPGAPNPPMTLRNLTAQNFGAKIPAGESETFTYSFANDMHPQDLTLGLFALLQDSNQKLYTSHFYNATVSVVEAPTSILDPQMMFLYLILAGAFFGTCYMIYSTWISTLFPQKRGRGKGGERAKKSSLGSKTVDPSDQVAVLGEDGPAVTSGAQAYDASWIPAHHLQRPEAKRVSSGSRGPKPKTRQAQTSP